MFNRQLVFRIIFRPKLDQESVFSKNELQRVASGCATKTTECFYNGDDFRKKQDCSYQDEALNVPTAF